MPDRKIQVLKAEAEVGPEIEAQEKCQTGKSKY